LWSEAGNLARYHEDHPDAFRAMQSRLGWRVRPAWVWQRKRGGATELVVAFANDGVAGVPGTLRVLVESPDGSLLRVGGSLDAGHPYAGQLRQASFILPRDFRGDTVSLRAEIEVKGVRRPARWACAQAASNGTLTLKLKAADDPAWRKGI